MTGLGIRPAAIGAWQSLHAALLDLHQPVPCRSDPDAWTDPPDQQTAEHAANLCGRCPVLLLCDRFAAANGESVGIWAGIDRTPKRGRPPAQPERNTA